MGSKCAFTPVNSASSPIFALASERCVSRARRWAFDLQIGNIFQDSGKLPKVFGGLSRTWGKIARRLGNPSQDLGNVSRAFGGLFRDSSEIAGVPGKVSQILGGLPVSPA